MTQQFLPHPTHWKNKHREDNSSYASILAWAGALLTIQRRDGKQTGTMELGTWYVEQGWVVLTDAQGNRATCIVWSLLSGVSVTSVTVTSTPLNASFYMSYMP